MIMEEPTSLQTLWKFSPSLRQNTTEEESTIVTRKIKIYPTEKQRTLFRRCIGTHRYFYNKAVAEINKRYKEKLQKFINHPTCVHCEEPKVEGTFACKAHKKKALPWNLEINLQFIRKAVLKSDSQLDSTEQWQKLVPYDTRQLAIKDAVSAYKSATALKIKGIVQQFFLKFKRKGTPKQSFWVNKNAISKDWKIFTMRLKDDSKLHINKRHLDFLKKKSIENDAQIMNDRGSWYLLLTYKRKKEAFREAEYQSIALDPGIRTFQTGYSPQGLVLKMGEKQIQQVKKLHERLDCLRSVRTKVTKNDQKNISRKDYLSYRKRFLI